MSGQKSGLTTREREIIGLLAGSGLTYRQVGQALGIAPGTVKNHVHAVADRLPGDAPALRRVLSYAERLLKIEAA